MDPALFFVQLWTVFASINLELIPNNDAAHFTAFLCLLALWWFPEVVCTFYAVSFSLGVLIFIPNFGSTPEASTVAMLVCAFCSKVLWERPRVPVQTAASSDVHSLNQDGNRQTKGVTTRQCLASKQPRRVRSVAPFLGIAWAAGKLTQLPASSAAKRGAGGAGCRGARLPPPMSTFKAPAGGITNGITNGITRMAGLPGLTSNLAQMARSR